MNDINLIPRRRLTARQRYFWRVRCGIACGAYAVVVTIVVVGARTVAARDDATMPLMLDQASSDIDSTSGKLATIKVELDATESLLRSSKAIAEQPDWSSLMSLLAAKAQDQVVFKEISVRPKEAIAPPAPKPGRPPEKPPAAAPAIVLVSISGAGITQAAASEYALRLEATGLFGRVSLLDTSRETLADFSTVAFRIECTLGDKPTSPSVGKGFANGGEP